MTGLLLAITYALLSQGLIYAGVAFINGQLAPAALAPAYAALGSWGRLAAMFPIAILPANLLIAATYRLVDPGTAGMTVLSTLIIVLVSKSLLLGDGAVTPRLVAATAAAVAAACWVAYELHQHG